MSLELVFPSLVADGYAVTSAVTSDYNCVAWAAGIDSAWWDPATGYYWPEGVPREHGLEALQAVFAGLGFTVCENVEPEAGFDKVALYGMQGEWTHAARMLGNGKWTSKLGAQEDIEHATPNGVAGSAYGKVFCVMKKPVSLSETK